MPVQTLTSKKAAELLGIKEATLYAYVSRGMIRSVEPQPGDDPRVRHYVAEDVYALMRRKSHRRDPTKAAEDALNWGTPVLESALTRIENGRLFYRGRDAASLALTATFEEVAGLLWLPGEPAPLPFDEWDAPDESAQPAPPTTDAPAAPFPVPTLATLSAKVALAAADDVRAFDTSPQGTASTGRQIIRLMTDSLTVRTGAQSIAADLAATYGGTTRLFDAALILTADHELNASSFTARVVASTGADPYAVVSAALAALSGPKHGGAGLRVFSLLAEAAALPQPESAVIARLRRGETIPGFGHVLYPDGDPRYVRLMSVLGVAFAESPRFLLCQTLADAARAVTGSMPNIDFALATLVYTLGQPPELVPALFALGRTAGWIAHAIEQYSSGTLIRPRAKYVGE